jgi:hypothetical protein
VKRNADSKVKYGQDIMSGKQFVTQMKDSEIFCCLITDEEISNMQQQFDMAKLITEKLYRTDLWITIFDSF